MTTESPPFLPACMTADELATWADSNRHITSQQDRAAWPCHDCTLGFAAEMRAQDRCNGEPGGLEEEPEMDDLTPKPAVPRPPLTLRRSVDLDVTPPACGSCLHEPVCALRQAVEAIATVETTRPPLPDGLRLTLAATIACDHYARDRAKRAPARELTSEQRGAANRIAGEGSRHHFTPEGLERLRESGRKTGRIRRSAAPDQA